MLFIIFTCILLVVVIILYIDKNRLANQHLHYSKVPRVNGEFAVHPSIDDDRLVTVNQCSNKGIGVLGQQPCIFGNINSLHEAIEICNHYIVVCPAFVYNVKNKTVTLIEKPDSFQSSPHSNLDGFVRQIQYDTSKKIIR